jgi:DNA-binding PadR family transcriptional regulator
MRYLDLVILGLLKEGPRYGYQIQQLIRQRHMDQYIRLAVSSMYKTLARLEREGYVKSHAQQVGARPTRRIFHITPKGEEQLRKLLEKAFRKIESYHDPLYAALTFAHHLPPQEVAGHLRARLEWTQGMIRNLREHLEQVRGITEEYGVDTFYAQAILRGGIKGLSAEAEWLEELIRDLEERRCSS